MPADDRTSVALSGGVPRITLTGILCLVCGLLEMHKVNLIGEVYLAELALPLACLTGLRSPVAGQLFRNRAFVALLAAMALSFAGYVISDLVRETSPDQYLRGWGRIALVMTDFVALSVLVAADRRNLWWFAAGIGVGGVLYLRLWTGLPISHWKFGYAQPMTLLAAAAACFLPLRASAALMLLMAILSLRYDFRIHAAVTLAIATLMWLHAGRRGRPLPALALAVAIAAALALLVAALKGGEDEYYRQRRETSNLGRSIGIEFAGRAVLESPLIGWGSWGAEKELTRLEREVTRRAAREAGVYYPDTASGTSAAHSQLLQSWVEGGLLGASLFFVLGAALLRQAPALMLRRPPDLLTPVLLYFFFYGLWNLIMSPFVATTRVQIAATAASLVCLAFERARGALNPRRPARAPATAPPTFTRL